MPKAIPLAIQPIIQLTTADCGVAALAMLLGKPYAQVARSLLKTHPKAKSEGMWTGEMITVAKRYKTLLKVRSPKVLFERDDLTGLITTTDHVAVLFQGVVIDPNDGQVWDLETWISTNDHKVVEVLEVVE